MGEKKIFIDDQFKQYKGDVTKIAVMLDHINEARRIYNDLPETVKAEIGVFPQLNKRRIRFLNIIRRHPLTVDKINEINSNGKTVSFYLDHAASGLKRYLREREKGVKDE